MKQNRYVISDPEIVEQPFTVSSGTGQWKERGFRRTGIFRILVIVLSFLRLEVHAQSEHNYDKRLLNHYSADQLDELMKSDTAKFNAVCYYYTSSFSITRIECDDCVPFDPDSFDVSLFERFRNPTQPVVLYYEKYGFELTLFPLNNLKYTIPLQNR